MIIRQLLEDEYNASLDMIKLCEPQRAESIVAWQREDKRAEADLLRLVAVDESSQSIVGYAVTWHVRQAKYRLDLIVHPDYHSYGIETQLLHEQFDSLRAKNAETVQVRVNEHDIAKLDFYTKHRFAEIHRMYDLRLNLDEAVLDRFQLLQSQAVEQGISIATLQELQARDSHCWHKLADLQNSVLVDWPDPDPGTVDYLSPDRFCQMLEEWQVIPDAFYIALHAGRYIAYSGLTRSDDPSRLESGGTATRAEYRGQQIATLLKMYSIDYARGHGYHALATCSANPIMIEINKKLGFQQGQGEVRLVMTL